MGAAASGPAFARDMTGLPTDTLPAAEYLVRHMYRPVELGTNQTHFAIAETAMPIGGDSWFWSDDNAKVLEFLSRPELWRRFPTETAEILRFVRAMCHGPLIFRRVSPPRLEPIEKRDTRSRYRHSLMNVEYDLSRGSVAAGLRFHDERNSENLLLGGNRVEFTHLRRHYRLDVEPAISDVNAQQDGHRLILRHSGDLHFKSRRRLIRFGRITYAYSIDARSMFIDVEVTLEIAAGIQVTDVVLTIGHRQPSGIYYRTIDTDIGRTKPLFRAGIPGWRRRGVEGASYYVIRQSHISGDSWGIHSISCDPARLSAIEAVVQHWGRFHRVTACYSFPGKQCGTRLVVRERKLVTGGGFYDRIEDYRALMQGVGSSLSSQQAAWDLSTSYDYGSAINAFAKCFAVCNAGIVRTDETLDTDELRSLFDTYFNHYGDVFANSHRQRPNAIFSRDLAFVILGLVTMYKVTNAVDYRTQLARLCEMLLEFEVRFQDTWGAHASGFLMRMDSPRAAFVDCHSAALLALTQAVRYIDDPRLVETLERGLGSYSIESCGVGPGSQYPIETVSTHMVDRRGTRRTQNAFWNFKAGLTLRLFDALRNSPNPSLRSVALRHGERMERLEMILRQQIERSITPRENGIEIRTSVSSGETNSETQPWVMLGLFGHPAD
jgi:hypothetical protein